MSDIPVVVCSAGPLVGRSWDVGERGIKVGRADDNDIVVKDDDGVSRYHAQLILVNGSLWVRDSGSRNGVHVNGKRIADHKAINVGDEVKVGDSVFVVQWKGEEKAPPKAPVEQPKAKKRWFWPFE